LSASYLKEVIVTAIKTLEKVKVHGHDIARFVKNTNKNLEEFRVADDKKQ
jgi:hypothetical protein